MKLSGYIEGFYGRFFTWRQRRKIVETVFSKKMNVYLYAPKEDKFHRICWKEPYPAAQTEKFEEIIDFANVRNCEFIPAIAPGLSYKFDESDYQDLRKKIAYFAGLNAKSFALTMDDIPCRENLGVLHGELLKRIKDDFRDLKTLFCPTVYATDLIEENSRYYLDELRENMPENTLLFWTGDSTIARKIDKKSLLDATKLFGEKCVIWDNFYCNDYAPNRIFVGEYEGRDRDFCEKECAGVLINGTGLPISDEIILEIFYAWLNEKPADIKNILLSFGVPKELLEYLPAISSPYKQDYTIPATLCAADFFTLIIAEWQSPLKMEWYAALHAIFTEIRVANAEKSFTDEWFGMRYVAGKGAKNEKSGRNSLSPA